MWYSWKLTWEDEINTLDGYTYEYVLRIVRNRVINLLVSCSLWGSTMPGEGNIYNSSMVVPNSDPRSLVPGIIPTQQDFLFPKGKHDRHEILLPMNAFRRKMIRLYAGMRVCLAIFGALFEVYMKVEGTNLQFPWRARADLERYISAARSGATRTQVIAAVINTAFDRHIIGCCLVRQT